MPKYLVTRVLMAEIDAYNADAAFRLAREMSNAELDVVDTDIEPSDTEDEL